MAKCAVFQNDEAIWAWQPFGPGETITNFTVLGSHYRGFPVVKIGDAAKRRIEAGERVSFRYKGIKYTAFRDLIYPE